MKTLMTGIFAMIFFGAAAQNDSIIMNSGAVLRGQIVESNYYYLCLMKDSVKYLINKKNVGRYTLSSSGGNVDYHVSNMDFDPTRYTFQDKGHNVERLTYTAPVVRAGKALTATGVLWVIAAAVEGIGIGLRSAPATYAGIAPAGGGLISLIVSGVQLSNAHKRERAYKFIQE